MSTVLATVPVAPVDRRLRVPQAAIDEVVRHIATTFGPEQIILFGSYAYGDPRPESDVDLLVVMDTPLRETAQAVRILQSIEHHFGLDVVVRTPASLARRLDMGDPFIAEILARGKVVYERTDA